MNDIQRRALALATIAALLTPLAAAQGPTDTRLAPILRTEQTGAGVVRILYDLEGTDGSLFAVSLEVSNDGGRTFAISPRAVTGDIGPGVSPGNGKAIVWDSTKDVEELQIDRFVFRVRVSSGPAAEAPAASAPAPSPQAGSSAGGRGAPARGTASGATKKGGLSKGAIAALTGGAAAGGIGLAVAKGKGSSSTPPPPPPPTSTPTPTPPSTTVRAFRGTVTGPITFDFPICLSRGPGSQTEDWTFTLVISLNVTSTGTVTGSAVGTVTRVLVSGCPGTAVGTSSIFGLPLTQVTGTTSSVMFSGTETTAARTNQWNFAGSLAADVLSGTLEYTATIPANAPTGGDGARRDSP